MRYLEPSSDRASELPVLELTRRNLTALLAKLDDPASQRTLIDPDGRIAVRAVENSAHYADRRPGPTLTSGVYDDGSTCA